MKNTFNNDLSYYVWLNINGISEAENSFFANTASNLISLNKDTDDIMAMREYKDEVSSGNSTKAYWCLVKSLDGYDSKYYYTRDNNEVYNKKEPKAPDSGNIKLDDEYDHIYIEIDWDRRYPPNEAQLQLVADSFKQHNIILHIDAGAHSVNYDEKENCGNAITFTYYSNNEEFIRQIVNDNFSFRKKYRYCLYIPEIYLQSESSSNIILGLSDNVPGRMFKIAKQRINVIRMQGDDFEESSECENLEESSEYENLEESSAYENLEALTFMHELGHTLGLYHGGDEAVNYKPNHVSIMNYSYSHRGLLADNKLNFSEYKFPKINDFAHINEKTSIDPYKIDNTNKGIRWMIKNDRGETEPDFGFYWSGDSKNIKGVDFNADGKLGNDENINFYISFETEMSVSGIQNLVKQALFDNFGQYRNCKESVNDWNVIYKNILPIENINYAGIKY